MEIIKWEHQLKVLQNSLEEADGRRVKILKDYCGYIAKKKKLKSWDYQGFKAIFKHQVHANRLFRRYARKGLVSNALGICETLYSFDLTYVL